VGPRHRDRGEDRDPVVSQRAVGETRVPGEA